MKRVLLTNGENIRTLMIVRALADSDVEIHVLGQHNFSACAFSRYVHKFSKCPQAKTYPEQFLVFLKDYVAQNRINVLIPVNADDLDVVLKSRSMFGNIEIPFPEYDLFRKIKDKASFFHIASNSGLKVPNTQIVKYLSELDSLKLRYPLIVKIRTGAGSKGVQMVKDALELKDTFRTLVSKFKLSRDNYPIVQEYLDGKMMCVAAVCNKGKVLGVMAYESLRQLPVKHGTSTFRVSVKDPDLCELVSKFLKKLRWHGVAQLDLIKIGDQYYFLEFNPRFYTSLSVTVRSGLNIPLMITDLSNSKNVTEYKYGVACKILMPDTLAVLLGAPRIGPRFEKVYVDDFDSKDVLCSLPLIVKFIRGNLL